MGWCDIMKIHWGVEKRACGPAWSYLETTLCLQAETVMEGL